VPRSSCEQQQELPTAGIISGVVHFRHRFSHRKCFEAALSERLRSVGLRPTNSPSACAEDQPLRRRVAALGGRLLIGIKMFTILTFGLCALVIENAGDAAGATAMDYPAVGIGVVARNQCRVTLVLAAGKQTLAIPFNGQFHRFKVEKIDQVSALIWIDDEQSFVVPRKNGF
jgi:hypothetical protein